MKRKRRATAIVPRVVFTTVCVGVVPVCVLECGSGSSGGPQTCQYGCLGVAAIGYDQFSVADVGFVQHDVAADAFGFVADAGFHGETGAGEAGDATTPGDAPVEAAEAGDGGEAGG